jgi:hypothetical protein
VPGTNPALQTWNGQAFVVADGSAQNRISLPFLQVNSGAATYVVGADNNGVWSYYSPNLSPNLSGGSAGQVPYQISTNVTGFTATGANGQLLQSGATNSPTWIAPNNLLVTATGSTTPRTLANRFADIVNVKDFGAEGNGIADDTAAIQAAINSLPNKGGTIFIPSGVYKVTSTITVGNGTDSARSTKNSIELIGEGAPGYGPGESSGLRNTANNGTTLKWSGSAGGTVVAFNGSGDGFNYSKIEIDCNNTAGIGLLLRSIRQSSFTDFAIRNFTSIGMSLEITQYGGIYEGKLNHGSGNIFQNFLVNTYFVGETKGLSIKGKWDGLPAPITTHADWYRNTFISGLFQVANPITGSAGYSTSGYFEFCDSNTFIEVDFTYQSDAPTSGTAYGITLNGSNNSGYPQNNFFYGCSLKGQINVIGTIGDHFFINFPTVDGEIIPNNPNLRGITDTGKLFGSFEAFQDLTINKNSAAYKLRTRPGIDSRGYDLLANDSGAVEAGFSLIQKYFNGTSSTVMRVDESGDAYAFFTGLGLKKIQFGSADSAGAGFRTLRIEN